MYEIDLFVECSKTIIKQHTESKLTCLAFPFVLLNVIWDHRWSRVCSVMFLHRKTSFHIRNEAPDGKMNQTDLTGAGCLVLYVRLSRSKDKNVRNQVRIPSMCTPKNR